jgi:glycosyltransferase involved in cell wall biosynthesis
MSDASLSVVVFAHAPYAKYLAACLNSILSQSRPPMEVVILSDGSNEIAAVVSSFRNDKWISLVDQGEGHFFRALNKVAEGCRGECIALMDSDDLYNRDHLKVLVELFQRYPDTGLAFDNVEYFDDTKENPEFGVESKFGEEHLLIPTTSAKVLASRPLSIQEIFIDNLVTGPSSLLRKDAFVRVGGYDEKAFVIGDLHLFYRVGAYYGIRFADYVGVQKRVHAQSTTGINPHYEFGIKGLESIRDNYPDVYRRIGKMVFDKKLGRKYFRAGLHYEKLGDRGRARAAYKKAALLRMFSVRYHWNFLRTYLGAHTN